MSLKTFLATVARYWKTFSAVAAAVFALGLAWLLLTPAGYVSTTQLMVSISGASTAAAYQNDEVVTSRINSYLPLLTSDVVSQRVIDRLGLPLTAPELAAKVNATNVPPKTSIIDVAVTANSPEQAQLLADTYAREFVAYATALETPTGEDGQKVHVTIVSSASRPHSDRTERVVLGCLAAVLALVLGCVAVWIHSLVDPLVRTAERAEEAGGLPVLGTVSTGTALGAEELEDYRRLRTALKAASGGGDRRVLEIVPVDSHEDARPVATHLARLLRLTTKRCVIIDVGSPDIGGDRPEPHGLEPTDTIAKPEWVSEPDRISTPAAAEFVAGLRADNDHVIIAAPPLRSGTAASALSEYTDAVVLVASAERTKRSDLRGAVTSLNSAGAHVIGVVLARGGSHSGGGPGEGANDGKDDADSGTMGSTRGERLEVEQDAQQSTQ